MAATGVEKGVSQDPGAEQSAKVRAELAELGFVRVGGVELEGLRLRVARRDEIYEHKTRSCVALFRPAAGVERSVVRLESHLSDGTVIQTVLDDWIVRLTLGPFSSNYDRHLNMKVVSFVGNSVRELSTAHVREMNALARARNATPRETRAESIGGRIERSGSTVAMASVLRQISWFLAIALAGMSPFACAMLLGFPLARVPIFVPVGLVVLVVVYFGLSWITPVLVRATPLENRRVFGDPALSRIVTPTQRKENLFDDRPPLSRGVAQLTSSLRRIRNRGSAKK